MASICLYFQVHQPNRLKKYSFFDIGSEPFYEDDQLNAEFLNKVSDKCYLPANKMLLQLIKETKGAFKVAFSLSGVLLEQLEHHRPDVLASFQELVNTGSVELLSETYYHSLAYFYSKDEFKRQVKLHKKKIETLFGVKPKVFRNTELIYSNEIAAYVEQMGFKGIMTEGIDSLLGGRSSNYLYKAPNCDKIKTFLRNYSLSDDIGFRFSDKNWSEYPLNGNKYADWLSQEQGEIINIFMDYESIGEHQWADTGIFDFFRHWPKDILSRGLSFTTPSEAIKKCSAEGIFDAHNPISWADKERDLSAWLQNSMQHEAVSKIHSLEKKVKTAKNKHLLHVWSKLQSSDHFYYMCTKGEQDGVVHNYFSPYDSPYDGYIYFMNALSDLEICLNKRKTRAKKTEEAKKLIDQDRLEKNKEKDNGLITA